MKPIRVAEKSTAIEVLAPSLAELPSPSFATDCRAMLVGTKHRLVIKP